MKLIEGEMIQLSKRGDIEISEDRYIGNHPAEEQRTCSPDVGKFHASWLMRPKPVPGESGTTASTWGIAFQIVDDILDFTGQGKVLGKPAASDLSEGTVTLPIIYALKKADQAEKECIRKIMDDGGRLW